MFKFTSTGLNISDEFMELIEKCDGGGNIDDTWNVNRSSY